MPTHRHMAVYHVYHLPYHHMGCNARCGTVAPLVRTLTLHQCVDELGTHCYEKRAAGHKQPFCYFYLNYYCTDRHQQHHHLSGTDGPNGLQVVKHCPLTSYREPGRVPRPQRGSAAGGAASLLLCRRCCVLAEQAVRQALCGTVPRSPYCGHGSRAPGWRPCAHPPRTGTTPRKLHVLDRHTLLRTGHPVAPHFAAHTSARARARPASEPRRPAGPQAKYYSQQPPR